MNEWAIQYHRSAFSLPMVWRALKINYQRNLQRMIFALLISLIDYLPASGWPDVPPPTTPVNNSSNNSDGNNNNNWPHHFDRNKNNPMHSGGYFLSTIEIRRLEQPKWTTESCHNRMQLIKTNLNEKHSMKWRKKGIDQVTQWRHFTAISFPPFPAIFLRFSSFHHFLLS